VVEVWKYEYRGQRRFNVQSLEDNRLRNAAILYRPTGRRHVGKFKSRKMDHKWDSEEAPMAQNLTLKKKGEDKKKKR
jgi:hypothetical protein